MGLIQVSRLLLPLLFAACFLSGCQTVGKIVTEPWRGSTGISENWDTQKGEVPGFSDAEYRIYKTADKVENTIVFLHGYFDDVRIFEESLHDESLLRELVEKMGPVRIVVVSFGIRWMLTSYSPRSTRPKEATVKNFVSEVLPFLEKKYQFKGPYTLIGRSMGGSNAAALCALHPELWKECVLLNPMLIPDEIDPFWLPGNDQWKASYIIKSQYEGLEQWQAHRPSENLKAASRLPRTYVTACKEDGFDLFPGPKQWSEQALKQGHEVVWVPVEKDCDHKIWPLPPLLKFLGLAK